MTKEEEKKTALLYNRLSELFANILLLYNIPFRTKNVVKISLENVAHEFITVVCEIDVIKCIINDRYKLTQYDYNMPEICRKITNDIYEISKYDFSCFYEKGYNETAIQRLLETHRMNHNIIYYNKLYERIYQEIPYDVGA